MALSRPQMHRSASIPVSIGRSSSVSLVDDAEKRIDKEVEQLVRDIRRIGPTHPDPAPHVLFGELFDDEFVEQYYEALLGTLKAAKKRGIIKFKGQMLLKGMHDNVVISIVEECPPPKIDISCQNKPKETMGTIAKPSMGQKANIRRERRATSYLPGEIARAASADEAEKGGIVGREDRYLPQNAVHTEKLVLPEGRKVETKKKEGYGGKIDASARVAGSWTPSLSSSSTAETKTNEVYGGKVDAAATVGGSSTPSTSLSSTKKFSFSTPEQEEHQQRIVEKNRFENGPQTKGNWKPAPWRQRPQSTTALSGHMTRPKKKDGKRRLSAPIARKGEGSMSEMTSDNSRPGTDGGGGRINVNMCSVPEEDVSLKAPPNSSSRGSGNGGLSKAAVAALGGTPGNTNNSTSKTSAARRFLRPRTGGERVTTTESRDGKSNYGGEEDQASVSSIGGSSIGGSSIGGASIASAPARMRAGSFHAVEAHKARLDEEIDQLLVDIRRVGTNPGEPSVAFGELFDDDEVQNYYEALVGTLKSAKRRGVVHFKGQMLLKGMHDNVMIDIVNP